MLVTTVIGQVPVMASATSAAKPAVVVRPFLEEFGAHKTADSKSLMTPSYASFIARDDSLFTNVITLADVTVGGAHYYGVRHANVPRAFVINEHHIGGWNNGKVTFAFQLAESRPGSPWRVSSGETG